MESERGRGRPPFEITDEVLAKVFDLASIGLPFVHIAASIGISYETFNEKRKAFPDFSDALALGKAESLPTVVHALFNKCIEGDVPAIKYYLNNQDAEHWKNMVTTDTTVRLTNLTDDEIERELEQLEQLTNEQGSET